MNCHVVNLVENLGGSKQQYLVLSNGEKTKRHHQSLLVLRKYVNSKKATSEMLWLETEKYSGAGTIRTDDFETQHNSNRTPKTISREQMFEKLRILGTWLEKPIGVKRGWLFSCDGLCCPEIHLAWGCSTGLRARPQLTRAWLFRDAPQRETVQDRLSMCCCLPAWWFWRTVLGPRIFLFAVIPLWVKVHQPARLLLVGKGGYRTKLHNVPPQLRHLLHRFPS